MANTAKTIVTLEDGTKHVYSLTPYAYIKAEQYLAARGQTIQNSAYTAAVFGAYAQATYAGDTNAPFDTWLATVVELKTDSEDEGEDEEAASFHAVE